MNWKAWPYWVRGLLVGCVVGVLVGIYILLNQEDLLNQPTCLAIGICDPYISLPLLYITLASLFVACSLLGAFLGHLYGKFKNRKQLSTNQ